MQIADAARAEFVDLVDTGGKVLCRRPTAWDGESFVMDATSDEVAATDLLRFTDDDGLVIGELPIQHFTAA